MSDLDTGANAQHCYLLQFEWGALNVVRYAAWTDSVTLDGRVYSSQPAIEVSPEAVQGGVEEKPWHVKMLALSPLDDIATGYPHAEVTAVIRECDPADPDNTSRIVFSGWVGRLIANYGGRRDVVRFEVNGIRSRMRGKFLGVPATTQCAWNFGDKGCCVDVAALRETAVVDTISGADVTVLALTTSTARYWHRGYVELDGLRIMVRNYDTGLTLTLAKRPPVSWVGETLTLTPGCSKLIDDCRDKWNNEARFGGVGFKIPAYHPVISAP